MPASNLSRRTFLGTSAVAALTAVQAQTARATETKTDSNDPDAFHYEITRSEEEWKDILTDSEFAILRESETEEKFSSPYWDSREEGNYHCRGCDLKIYDSTWQEYPDIGWVFFRHSEPLSVVTDIHGSPYADDGVTDIRILSIIQARCRRCGSHFGHILTVKGTTLHCINGTSLTFRPVAA